MLLVRAVAVTLSAIALLAAGAATDPAILRVLYSQQEAWNRGDVRAFMETYEDSPDTAFVGAGGITRGRAEILARYLKRYDRPEKMGTLTFADLEVRQLCADHASVIGRWRLERQPAFGGDAGGIFTLLLRKTTAGWRIVLDHTQ